MGSRQGPGGSRARPRAACALTLLLALACGGAEEARPDLVLVSVDTLRADRLGIYGAESAPEGREAFSPGWLAERGTVFEQCWSPAGQTLPALASFWTGRPPLEHGAVTNFHRLQGFRSRAEDLAEAGWLCLGRAANATLQPGTGIAAGFERTPGGWRAGPWTYEERMAEELLELAAPAVRGRRPLLLWAHHMAPHQPYEPPLELLEDPGPGPLRAGKELLQDLERQGPPVDPVLARRLRTLYDAEIRVSARNLRRLLEGLDRLYREAGRGGLLENAVVVFFSDHGEELGDRNAYFPHAKSLYAGVIRVPLVIAGPGWAAGRRDPRPLGLDEVLPWVLEGREPSRRYHVAAWRSSYFAVRDERWTLIHSPLPEEERRLGPWEPLLPADGGRYPYPAVALFDRNADPGEHHDLSVEYPEETRRLLGALRAWYEELVPPARYRPAAGVQDAVLEQLGYAGSAASQGPAGGLRGLEGLPWRPEEWRP